MEDTYAPCGKLKAIWLLAALVVLFSANKVHADNLLDMGLEELLQVNVTGSTLRSESLKTVPAAVTVFTHQQIKALGLDYLYELLNLVPDYQSDRNGDSPSGYTFSSRGRRNSSEAREVLLIVDGRVFADPRTGSADGSLPLFPLEQIERIEIISGPGSAIYGSGAFNGVINIVSRQSQNQVSLSTGNNGQVTADLLAHHQSNEWELNAYGHFYQDDGQDYSLASTTTNDPRNDVALNFSLDTDTTRIQAAYHHLVSDNFYTVENIFNNFNSYTQQFRQLGIDHQVLWNDSLKSKFSLSYVDIEQTFSGMILPELYLTGLSNPVSNDAFLVKGVFAGKTWTFDIANDIDLNGNSSVQFGAQWRRNQETAAEVKNNFDLAQLASGNFPINYYGDFTQSTPIGNLKSQDSSALYGQLLYAMSSETRLTLGSRFDYYDNIGQHISPRIGLVHQLQEYQTIKLLYGEAFRAPSLSEMGLINNPVLVGNSELNYEIVKTWDLVWQIAWNNTSLITNAFYNQYKDPIATGFTGNTRTYVNGSDEISHGVSFEINQQLNSYWRTRVHYTHFFELPDSAFREADALASAMLDYSHNDWSWNISAAYQGARQYLSTNNQRDSLNAHWSFNSQLGYSLNKKIQFNLAIKNLTDKEYSTPSQGAGLSVPNRGTEWRLGVDWQL